MTRLDQPPTEPDSFDGEEDSPRGQPPGAVDPPAGRPNELPEIPAAIQRELSPQESDERRRQCLRKYRRPRKRDREKKEYTRAPEGSSCELSWTSPSGTRLALKATSEWMVLRKKEKPVADIFHTHYRPAESAGRRPRRSCSMGALVRLRRICTGRAQANARGVYRERQSSTSAGPGDRQRRELD